MENLTPDSKLESASDMRARIQTIRRNRAAFIDRPRRPGYVTKAGDLQRERAKLDRFDARADALISRLRAMGEPWQ